MRTAVQARLHERRMIHAQYPSWNRSTIDATHRAHVGSCGTWQRGTGCESCGRRSSGARGCSPVCHGRREQRDPRAVEALFTQDADQFTTSGDWRRGRPAVVKGTAASSAQNPGRRDIAVEAVRFPASGVALVDGRYEIVGGANTARRMWTTLLLIRDAGGWRIAAIRNMVPTGAAPAGDR